MYELFNYIYLRYYLPNIAYITDIKAIIIIIFL